MGTDLYGIMFLYRILSHILLRGFLKRYTTNVAANIPAVLAVRSKGSVSRYAVNASCEASATDARIRPLIIISEYV